MIADCIYEVDELIRQILKMEKLSYISLFGMGKLGTEFLNKTGLKEVIRPVLYDNDSCKNGKIINDKYRISLPSEEMPSNTLIVVTSYYDKSIAEQLKGRGINTWCSLAYIEKFIEIHKKLSKPEIRACMLEASSFCNAKCKFCKNPTMNRKRQHMSRDVFEKVIFRLKDENHYPDRFSLHLLGEPLLDPDIFYKIRRLKEEFPDSAVGYTSNANCMNKEIVRNIFSSGQDYLTISINAIDEDEYRDQMGGLEYKKTIDNVTYLLDEKKKRKSDLKITMSIVVSKGQEREACDFREKWEREDVYVRVMHMGEWLENNSSAVETDRGILKKCIQDGGSCNMLLEELTIFSNGDYALCCFDAEGVLKMGNIMDTSIKELYDNAERKDLIYGLLNGNNSVQLCQNCSFNV